MTILTNPRIILSLLRDDKLFAPRGDPVCGAEVGRKAYLDVLEVASSFFTRDDGVVVCTCIGRMTGASGVPSSSYAVARTSARTAPLSITL